MLSIIVAISENGGIGFQGKIPWRLSTDMKLFKETTMGHHLIIGRVTYESILRPLTGRHMIVVTSQTDYSAPGCDVVDSFKAGLALARSHNDEEIFIAGGVSLYQEVLPITDRIYLTRVHAEVEVDRFFPKFDISDWQLSSETKYPAGEKDMYAFSVQVLDKRKNLIDLRLQSPYQYFGH
ncbi:MAG: dihydrofolate reductase [Chloroflexota bacterium]